MTKKIYVGNLSFSTTEDSLRSLFSPFGEVSSVVVMTDKFTGQSKGFGFVELEEEAAPKAIAALNGKDFEGRRLRVNEAVDRRGGGAGRRAGGRSDFRRDYARSSESEQY